MRNAVVYYNMYSNVTVQPFPQDFQMIVGNASWLSGGCENGHGAGNGYFYNGTADWYTLPRSYMKTLGTHITFPDCWDGQPFTKETQSQHMQYSTFDLGFPCPNPHWIKLPQLVLSVHIPSPSSQMDFADNTQFNYETPGTEEEYPTNKNGPTYVLATGDQYGCSLHADFMMGWEAGKLQQVIDECSSLGFGNTKLCPILTMSSASDRLANECQYSGLIPDEAIGITEAVDALPGCLSIDGKPARGCNSKVGFVEPSAFDTQYRSPGGWPIVTGMAPK
jgi:hypothetical protein